MKAGLSKTFAKNLRAFLSALSFLTRVPLPGFLHTNIDAETARDDFKRSVYWFPAAGVILGLLLIVFDSLLALLFPASLASGLLLTFYVGMTGGLHLDGLLDSADGLLSGRPAEKIPGIMRDSSSGAFAVLTAVLYILLKFLCFWHIFSGWRMGTFIFMAVLSRMIMAISLIKMPIVSESLARAFAGQFTLAASLKILWIPVILLFILPYLNLLPVYVMLAAAAVCLMATFLLTQQIAKMLGGLTGDIFGMINEINELLVLIVVIALQ